MVDIYSKEKRSEIMSRVRGEDTNLELKVRRSLWNRGKRYRTHDRSLPGRPDISKKKTKVAIFLDGCFWHGCQQHCVLPESNREFWEKKISRNVERRAEVRKELKQLDYTVLEYFECEINKNFDRILNEISSYL